MFARLLLRASGRPVCRLARLDSILDVMNVTLFVIAMAALALSGTGYGLTVSPIFTRIAWLARPTGYRGFTPAVPRRHTESGKVDKISTMQYAPPGFSPRELRSSDRPNRTPGGIEMTVTAPETATAARAVDAVKTYGAGDTAVHALAGVTVDSPRRSSPPSWVPPARARAR